MCWAEAGCFWYVYSKLKGNHPARLSFNMPKYIHTHWEVVGRDLLESTPERDAELLLPRPEYTICLKAKTKDPSLEWCAGSAVRRSCLLGLGWEVHPQLSSLGDSPVKQHSSPQSLGGGFFFFMGSKELFLYPSNSLWTVSKTWEVS